jgi:pimeloyl-ACP methyl ester carboxylesterase
MMSRIVRIVVGCACLSLSGACSDSKSASEKGDASVCTAIVKDADCDQSQRPIVFVHGTFGSGDNFSHVAVLLGSNGFCQDRIIAIEYNSLGDQPGTNGQLDAAIDDVLARTGFTQVDLAGHSQGTAHCKAYLADPAHAAKVAHYINFSGAGAVPNDVDTLSLSSLHDLGNTPHHATGTHVTAVTFDEEDHFAVAASTRSFIEVYKYLRGEDPRYTDVQCGDASVTIEGVAETFADNAPVTGKLELREVGESPRAAEAPVATLTPDASGHFGPIQLTRNREYEFKGFDAQGNLLGYQYFTPFKRSNRLVRLLSPSRNPAIAAASTDHIVRSPDHVAPVARWAGGAFRQDLGDSLKIDGTEVLTDGNSGTTAFGLSGLSGGVVGFFMYDANQNRRTDLSVDFSAPFIVGVDVFMDASTPRFVEMSFAAHDDTRATSRGTVKVPNWPSSDAPLLVFFQ